MFPSNPCYNLSQQNAFSGRTAKVTTNSCLLLCFFFIVLLVADVRVARGYTSPIRYSRLYLNGITPTRRATFMLPHRQRNGFDIDNVGVNLSSFGRGTANYKTISTLQRRSGDRSIIILCLSSTPSPSASSSCVVQRLGLADTFERWRFLQKLLDAEVKASDVNQLLYRVLSSFVSRYAASNKKKESKKKEGLPKMTNDIQCTIQDVLLRQDEDGTGVVWALRDPECSPGHDDVIANLEKLLPDPEEDEDAHKGTWDMIVELHGRESVKIREQEGSLEWKARCVTARVLIYYNFLADGVVEEPFS